MAHHSTMLVTKAGGRHEAFSIEKFQRSLRRAGAAEPAIEEVTRQVLAQFENGLSTRELYRLAFALLKHKRAEGPGVAARYRLKQGILELGPSGFPFERFVAALLRHEGFEADVGLLLDGRCVRHEVDVVARSPAATRLVECKYHNRRGDVTDVKVSLYIHARFLDLRAARPDETPEPEGWLVTNTRFTDDALRYGLCAGLHLLSWDFPLGKGLRERIDNGRLYPLTVLTTLSTAEKRLLIERGVMLCRDIVHDDRALQHTGIAAPRRERIIAEVRGLIGNY